MERKTVSSGRVWESNIGYSRAVRVGPLIEVSATAPSLPDGTILALGDISEQARIILGIVSDALGELDATLADIVRVTYLLKDPELAWTLSEVHTEFFREIKPALDFIYVTPGALKGVEVEISCTAYAA